MGSFSFVPVWIVQDIVVYVAALIVLFFILKREERPASVLLELVCFSFLYAAVYENFATMMGWYGYGRSILMVFNVPLSVPIVEYLVVYASLRLLRSSGIPTWGKPFLAGFMGMLFDFTLDPGAITQVFSTMERTIGRWSWFPGAGDVTIISEPAYNFSGWVLLCGYAAAFLLLGRAWHKKSGYKNSVGYLYPPLSMLAALVVLVTPLSNFLLWLGPFLKKGSVGEWVMLGFWFAIPIGLLCAFLSRKKPAGSEGAALKAEYPIFLVLIGLPLVNLAFTLCFSPLEAILLSAGGTIALALVVALLARRRKA